MRVRVKKDSKVLAVTAFGGCQYIRAEWRDVPAGCEKEAETHSYLEIEPKVEIKAEKKTETKQVLDNEAPTVEAKAAFDAKLKELETKAAKRAKTKSNSKSDLYEAVETIPELKEPVTVYEKKAKKPFTTPKKPKGKG